ncbi:MAG: sensor histidine kinase [Thermoleophilia bacterium]
MRVPFVRGLRGRLFLLTVLVVAAALAALTAAFNLVLDRTLDRDADELLRARAAAELAVLKPVGRRLTIAETADEAGADIPVWVFSRSRVLEKPAGASRAVDRIARSLGQGPARFLTVSTTDTRLYATPVVSGGRRLGTVVVGLSLAPYEQTKRTALVGSLALASGLLVAIALAVRWLLVAALRPVARMTAAAATWSEHDLDRRFDLGQPYDELTGLAHTLDGLLDRISASLRRERRFSAELSHEFRTPLSKIAAEVELALRRERRPEEYRGALERVLSYTHQLTRIVQALVTAAQHEAGAVRGTADAYAVAAQTLDGCAPLASEHGIVLRLAPPTAPLRVGIERDLVERILHPVVENACRYAQARVDVSVSREGRWIVYRVTDDGPGVADDEREAIFEAGVRGRAGRTAGRQGAGFGLALARRLARSSGGEIHAEAGHLGGRFVVRLPAG